jgi:hypothetical protein
MVVLHSKPLTDCPEILAIDRSVLNTNGTVNFLAAKSVR